MMAGFGKTKEVKEEEAEIVAVEETPAIKRTDEDPFSSLRKELGMLDNAPQTHVFMGIVGHDNTGKTAIVTDAYSKFMKANPESDEQLWILDFEGGGAANKSAFHRDNDNIKVWEAWVMMRGDSTAYDYPATHDRVMSITQFAVDLAKKQRDPEYDGPRLWGFLVTGVDLWDSVCVNCMRIVDLNIAKDGIEAADWNKKVGHQWDWAIRKTRFHQLTGLCRGLVKAGVRVFWETHLRLTNYSWGKAEDTNPSWRPDWEKASNNFVYQILTCEREDTIDDESGDIIKSEFTVRFDKSKTNAKLQGQKRTTLITEVGKDPQWFGLPELYDGTL
jgi:hypothetical protein|tara:strand:- start:2287 stop:3279 length:993 start_codon:yes stop_codon:yes gene_type:complete